MQLDKSKFLKVLINKLKPLSSLVNLKCLTITSLSELTAEAKWEFLAISMPIKIIIDHLLKFKF